MAEEPGSAETQNEGADRARTLDALKTAINQLVREINNRDGHAPSPDDTGALQAEIDCLRRLSRRADQGEVADHAERDPYRDIFEVLKSHVADQKPYGVTADALSTLRRMVEADIAATAPSSRIVRDATSSADGKALLPDEASLLASVTEKFYGSWAFKGLLVGIVCAVALAAIGTAVIGGESYNLSKRVHDAGDAGEKAITAATDAGRKSVDDQVNAAKEALGHRTDVIARLQDAIQTKTDAFGKEVDHAEAQIQQQRDDFKKNLQTDVLTQVIAGVKAQIEVPISETRTELDMFRRNKIAPLQTTVGEMDRTAGDVNGKLQQVSARIAPLNQLADSVQPLADKVNDIRAAADSVAQARADEAAAKAARSGAEAARDVITTQVDSLTKELPAAQKQLEDVKARLAEVSTAIATLTLPVSDVQTRLAALEAAVKALQNPKPLPPLSPLPKVPLSEECLSTENLQEIQRRLMALGFTPPNRKFDIDGNFGELTRGAIRRWQASVHEAARDARLTSAQITLLLGPQAACAETAPPPPPPR
jgi:regulator of replication initiation timing